MKKEIFSYRRAGGGVLREYITDDGPVFDYSDDGFSDREYNQMVYNALVEAGATNITYYETQGLGHDVCGEYAGYYNTSHLDWLYAQRRETVGPASSK